MTDSEAGGTGTSPHGVSPPGGAPVGRGNLLIVSAPSGAGKTSLVRALLQKEPRIRLSISHTTRPPRPGERDGHDYHFVDLPQFRAMKELEGFLEWAEVHGNHYGTSRAWLEAELDGGQDVLLEIDWQGADQVRHVFPEATGIFILPPSMPELERRLRARGQDQAEVIARRVAAARDEMRHAAEFDYIVMNEDFQEALADLLAIVRALRLRYHVQRQRYSRFFDTLAQD